MAINNSGRFIFLDYMRVFAFVSVLVGHKFQTELVATMGDPSTHITLRYFLEMIYLFCVGGAAGVVVFFLTSGYVITHVLQKEAAPDFLVKRLFRIYPLYMFAVISEALMGWLVNGIAIPPASVMIPRLLLLGDFFDVPNALAGVEWTLRIEILFYALMAALKASGAFSVQKALPIVYLVIAVAFYFLPAFPSVGHWNAAYVNTYSLFLFIGSIIYLLHHSLVSRKASVICFIMMLLFLSKIAAIQPGWKESNYAVAALFVFLAALYSNLNLRSGMLLTLLSDLTFSVYLFHNWLWGYLEIPIAKLGIQGVPLKLIIASVLLCVCYLLHRTIERYGLMVGRKILSATMKIRSPAGIT